LTTRVLIGVAIAGIVADLAWSNSINGDWDSQSSASVVVYFVLLALYVAAAVGAFVAALRSRSRGWIVGSLVLAVFAVGLALIGVFGVAFSRGPFI